MPSRQRDHNISRFIALEFRFRHRAYGLAYHDLSDLHRWRVRGPGIHTTAHVRVKREIDCAEQHLAGAGLGKGCFDQFEVIRFGLAGRARGENDPAVFFAYHGQSQGEH